MDKHGNEQDLQRISNFVVEACRMVGLMRKTEIPDLRRLWFVESRGRNRTSYLYMYQKGFSFLY